MFLKNTDIRIPDKYAIESNTCPFCGQKIMPDELKECIHNLSSALELFEDSFSSQLDDWIYSNYGYVKVGGDKFNKLLPEPKVIYKNKVAASSNEDDLEEDESLIAVQNPELTSKFFKNAEVSKTVARTDEFKKMVADIKSKNPKLAARQTMQLLQEEDDDFDQDSDVEDISSGLDNSYGDDSIPAAVLAMANQKSRPSHDYSSKDLVRLQQQRDRNLESRNNVINGTGGKGSFSRGY